MSRALAAVVLALVAASAPLAAQQTSPASRLSLEGGALYATVEGDDFEDIEPGVGFDLQGRYRFSAFSLGAGWQRTVHDITDISDEAIVTAFYVEPRYTIPATLSSFTPFLTARIGRVMQSVETVVVGVGEGELESSGLLIGGGIGLDYALTAIARVNVSTSFAHVSFGDVELDGDEIPDTEASGSSVILRAGLAFSFGR